MEQANQFNGAGRGQFPVGAQTFGAQNGYAQTGGTDGELTVGFGGPSAPAGGAFRNGGGAAQFLSPSGFSQRGGSGAGQRGGFKGPGTGKHSGRGRARHLTRDFRMNPVQPAASALTSTFGAGGVDAFAEDQSGSGGDDDQMMDDGGMSDGSASGWQQSGSPSFTPAPLAANSFAQSAFTGTKPFGSQFAPGSPRAGQGAFGSTSVFANMSTNSASLAVQERATQPKQRSHKEGNSVRTRIAETFQKMKEQRPAMMQKFIKEGTMMDPQKRYRLEEAFDLVGQCQTMCPEYESFERGAHGPLHEFEKSEQYDENGNQVTYSDGDPVMEMNPDLTVKRYRRAAADDEKPLPSDIRPAPVLKRTLDYLFYTILEEKGLAESHSFIRDRTRAIRTDLTLQNIRDMNAVEIDERIARFHLITAHQLCEMEGFDYKLELEQLRKTLQSLKEFYDELRQRGVVAPNEAEFRAYYLMTHIDLDELRFSQVLQQSNHLLGHPYLQLACKLRSLLKGVYPKGKDLTLTAYAKLFNTIASPSTPYLLACALHTHFLAIRQKALRDMFTTIKSTHAAGDTLYPLLDVVKLLGYDSEEKALAAVNHFNFATFTRDGVMYVDFDPDKRRPYKEGEKDPLVRRVEHRLLESKVGNPITPATWIALIDGQIPPLTQPVPDPIPTLSTRMPVSRLAATGLFDPDTSTPSSIFAVTLTPLEKQASRLLVSPPSSPFVSASGPSAAPKVDGPSQPGSVGPIPAGASNAWSGINVPPSNIPFPASAPSAPPAFPALARPSAAGGFQMPNGSPAPPPPVPASASWISNVAQPAVSIPASAATTTPVNQFNVGNVQQVNGIAITSTAPPIQNVAGLTSNANGIVSSTFPITPAQPAPTQNVGALFTPPSFQDSTKVVRSFPPLTGGPAFPVAPSQPTAQTNQQSFSTSWQTSVTISGSNQSGGSSSTSFFTASQPSVPPAIPIITVQSPTPAANAQQPFTPFSLFPTAAVAQQPPAQAGNVVQSSPSLSMFSTTPILQPSPAPPAAASNMAGSQTLPAQPAQPTPSAIFVSPSVYPPAPIPLPSTPSIATVSNIPVTSNMESATAPANRLASVVPTTGGTRASPVTNGPIPQRRASVATPTPKVVPVGRNEDAAQSGDESASEAWDGRQIDNRRDVSAEIDAERQRQKAAKKLASMQSCATGPSWTTPVKKQIVGISPGKKVALQKFTATRPTVESLNIAEIVLPHLLAREAETNQPRTIHFKLAVNTPWDGASTVQGAMCGSMLRRLMGSSDTEDEQLDPHVTSCRVLQKTGATGRFSECWGVVSHVDVAWEGGSEVVPNAKALGSGINVALFQFDVLNEEEVVEQTFWEYERKRMEGFLKTLPLQAKRAGHRIPVVLVHWTDQESAEDIRTRASNALRLKDISATYPVESFIWVHVPLAEGLNNSSVASRAIVEGLKDALEICPLEPDFKFNAYYDFLEKRLLGRGVYWASERQIERQCTRNMALNPSRNASIFNTLVDNFNNCLEAFVNVVANPGNEEIAFPAAEFAYVGDGDHGKERGRVPLDWNDVERINSVQDEFRMFGVPRLSEGGDEVVPELEEWGGHLPEVLRPLWTMYYGVALKVTSNLEVEDVEAKLQKIAHRFSEFATNIDEGHNFPVIELANDIFGMVSTALDEKLQTHELLKILPYLPQLADKYARVASESIHHRMAKWHSTVVTWKREDGKRKHSVGDGAEGNLKVNGSPPKRRRESGGEVGIRQDKGKGPVVALENEQMHVSPARRQNTPLPQIPAVRAIETPISPDRDAEVARLAAQQKSLDDTIRAMEASLKEAEAREGQIESHPPPLALLAILEES
ncbi:hypothetical protein HDV00_011152 [Rhizophlyctis rosea]|nr:hypothetical protein HDV00_011152 [Rhizophlyctis rosea]